LESPGLWGWSNESLVWERWVVGVGGVGSELAGLDTELGSVLQESLGGTAAEWLSWFSLQALRSWSLGCALGGWDEVTESIDSSVGGESGLGFICGFDLGNLGSLGGGGLCCLSSGCLGHSECSDLACLLGIAEHSGGGGNLSINGSLFGGKAIVHCLDWRVGLSGPELSGVMECLLFFNLSLSSGSSLKDSSGSSALVNKT
jgi:hypothetical protein